MEDVKIRVYGEFRSDVVNCIIFHAKNLKTLKLGPMVKFLENNFEQGLVMKLNMDEFESFCNLEELWLTFQHAEINVDFLRIMKFFLCSAPNIKKFVLEVMSDPCMRVHVPYYKQLANFCEMQMPEVEFIQI